MDAVVVAVGNKRKCFSLKEKYEIIKRLRQGVKQKQICQEMSLSKSTIATIWKNKDLVLNNFEQNSSNVKKVKKPSFVELDRCLLKWFTQNRANNVTITNAVLQAKAQEFGKKLNYCEFKCSESWIVRFRRRHNFTSGKIVGEAAEVNVDVGTESFSDNICFDDAIETTGELDDEAILKSVCASNDDDDIDDDMDMDNEGPVRVTTTALDAICSVSYVRTFLQSRNTPQQILGHLAQVEVYLNETNNGKDCMNRWGNMRDYYTRHNKPGVTATSFSTFTRKRLEKLSFLENIHLLRKQKLKTNPMEKLEENPANANQDEKPPNTIFESDKFDVFEVKSEVFNDDDDDDDDYCFDYDQSVDSSQTHEEFIPEEVSDENQQLQQQAVITAFDPLTANAAIKTETVLDPPIPPIPPFADTIKQPVKMTALEHYFAGICETVATFPPIRQAKIKMEISALVGKAEIEVLEERVNLLQAHGKK